MLKPCLADLYTAVPISGKQCLQFFLLEIDLVSTSITLLFSHDVIPSLMLDLCSLTLVMNSALYQNLGVLLTSLTLQNPSSAES